MGLFNLSLCESGTRAMNGEALVVEEFTNAPNQQHFVVLVVATIATTLHGPKLAELLLPIAQDMRLDAAQLADFTNGEVALGRDRRQIRGISHDWEGGAEQCRCG